MISVIFSKYDKIKNIMVFLLFHHKNELCIEVKT